MVTKFDQKGRVTHQRCADNCLAPPPLANPPVKLLTTFQLLIVFLFWGELEGLVVSQSQNTKHAEALITTACEPVPGAIDEVDQDVAAQDNIEFIEGTICCQIMLGRRCSP